MEECDLQLSWISIMDIFSERQQNKQTNEQIHNGDIFHSLKANWKDWDSEYLKSVSASMLTS